MIENKAKFVVVFTCYGKSTNCANFLVLSSRSSSNDRDMLVAWPRVRFDPEDDVNALCGISGWSGVNRKSAEWASGGDGCIDAVEEMRLTKI